MHTTRLVGIVNVTPDSFSDGGQFFDSGAAIAQIKKAFQDGASLVDVGAESTRPGATPLSSDEEWHRLEPVLRGIIANHPNTISIDTYHPETVARIATTFGPTFLVNDVTGFNNPAMLAVAARYQVGCIVSHLPSQFACDIQAAHQGPLISNVQQVEHELLERLHTLIQMGVPEQRIILDPGIGFGKTPELNRALLEFPRRIPDRPVLVGYSRKRFLGNNRFDSNVNLAAGRTAVAAGASYLRVHDIAGHRNLMTEQA